MAEGPKLIPISEAARLLSISRRTYERWAAEDPPRVPVPIVIGENDLRVVVSELEEHVEKRKAARDSARSKGAGAVPKNLNRSHLPPCPER
jgi:predicted DNA-binding transcriptional regulator AlpA